MEESKLDTPAAKPAEQVQEEPHFTPIQQKAMEQGWIPKEDFQGNEDEFIDAAEFVRRGELFDKIERQGKQLKQLREAHEAFRQHHSQVKEMEYNRALKALKAEKRQAMVDGETERAMYLEDRIDEVQVEKERLVQEVAETAVQVEEDYTPQMKSWITKNSWYENNPVMRAAADEIGRKYYNAGHTPEETLEYVAREIRKEFSNKFQASPASRRPSAVEGSTRTSTSKKDDFELTSDEREIMRTIVAMTPGYTEEMYKKELKAIKDRK